MIILMACFSYLFGAIPTGYILYRLSEKKDIRRFGSQSMGATNVLRLKGWRHALFVACVDILKGVLPVYLALRISLDQNYALLCGFLAVLGHCFPVYVKFKGGKGVATSVGVYIVIALKPLLCVAAIFLTVVILTRYVSLGSILGSSFIPLSILFFDGSVEMIYLSLAISFLVIFKHRENVVRLIKGNERKLGEKVS